MLIVADYYFSSAVARAGWIEDIRPYRAVMMPLDLPAKADDIEWFLPDGLRDGERGKQARRTFTFSMRESLTGALRDLGLEDRAIGFDDPGLGFRLDLEGTRLRDACDSLMYARAVKTPSELAKLQRATSLNETAIRRTIADWTPETTWSEMDRTYVRHVADLGGFVRDPSGMVWGHPRGADRSLVLATALDDGVVGEGTHVMFDCHGTIDLYCWDGGKTWVAGSEPEGPAKALDAATRNVAETLLAAMKPGARVSQLQATARAAYRRSGVPDADEAVIFFHGLGLSHMDIEQETADGKPNTDWTLEEGMVVPLHLLYPGGQKERLWLEEVVAIGADGGLPMFSWGFEALTGKG
ncbi:MAG: M24 family metallopeptidase [Minwuia sp.]|uniref:M24 family metallopeptidase n=1 Tax=Minwuia sp. TaxID=2493630 RepID=UPI003A897EBF